MISYGYADCHANCGSLTEGYGCASSETTDNQFITCPVGEVLVYASSQATKGTCTKAGSETVTSICGAGKYGVFDTVLTTPAFCGGVAEVSATCALYKATATGCSTYLYKSALSSGLAIIAIAN